VFDTIAYCFAPQNEIEHFKKDNNSDIELGAITWPIITSLEKASPVEKKVLLNNYGKKDPESVKKVREIFYDQDILGLFNKFMEKNRLDIEEGIDKFGKKYPQIPVDIFRDFQCYFKSPVEIENLETRHVPPFYTGTEPLPEKLLKKNNRKI